VFVRDPWSGPVKTRLARGCGQEQARNVYVLMTELLAHDLAPEEGDGYRLVLYVAPGDRAEAVGEWLFPSGTPGVSVSGQPETSLDLRMQAAVDAAPGPVILLGTDCPGVGRGDIRRICGLLESCDAVVGPANDGGFWMLGLARGVDGLLVDLPTSEPNTLAVLLDRLQTRGLRTLEIEERIDIDTMDDMALTDDVVRLRLAAAARARGMTLPDGFAP